MAGVITRGSFPKALMAGVHKWWGGEYKRHTPIWPSLFEALSSDQAYEEEVEEVGFGLMSEKPEGAGIPYDTAHQGATSRYTSVTWATGYIVTMEELMDNKYEGLAFRRTSKMARSVAETEETLAAQIFNRAFNSSFTGGDGVEFIATNHPTDSGDQSNELTTAADMSEASIEDMVIQIMDSVDSRGLRFNNKPRLLAVANANWFEANRIVKSVLQNDTSNNAVNVIKMTNAFPEGIIVNPYFSDADAWFIRTDCMDGTKRFTRMKPDIEQDNDFDTKNFRASVVMRLVYGWTNWRQWWGSQGA